MDALRNDTSWKRRVSRVTLVATLFLLSVNAFASSDSSDNALTTVRVSPGNNGTQLIISTPTVQWKVTLEPVSLFGKSAPDQRAFYHIPYFYRGKIQGEANSWVRINSDSELQPTLNTDAVHLNISGHIFIDDELFKLQHKEPSGYSLIATSDSSAGIDALKARYGSQQQTTPSKTGKTDKTDKQTKTLPLKAIKIGIMIDSRYNEYHNNRGLADALSIINGVDGLFQDQLGLAVIVERFKSYEDPQTDPLRNYAGNMQQMLSEFRQIRLNDAEFPNDLALVHLFTGHSNANDLIGVSWIGTVCHLDGYDVSISTPYPYSMLLSAHEIAHNLGALHDDDRMCLSDTSITGNQLMWSEISDSTQTSFSSCSLDAMRQSLSSSCVLDNIDMALKVTTTPTSFSLEQLVEVSAINWDITRASGLVSSITRFPELTQLSNQPAGCVLVNTRMVCLHGNISAYSQSTFSVTALLADSDSTLISSELLFSGFTDSNELNNNADVQANLFAQATSQALPQSTQAINHDGDNRGVVVGSSTGLGGLGPLGILWLSLLYCFINLNRGRHARR